MLTRASWTPFNERQAWLQATTAGAHATQFANIIQNSISFPGTEANRMQAVYIKTN